MRLHTDTLTMSDLYAALPSGVSAHITPKGSRKRARAFEVTLYVHEKDALHRHFGNSGGYGASDEVAATWDEWGIWMARLYDIDRDALVGRYRDFSHFQEVTSKERARIRAQYQPHNLMYRTRTAPWLTD